jgi:glycosyltransferase involved in cell wall biosynthesis
LRARPDVLIASLWQSVPAAMLIRLLRPRTRLVFMLHSEKTWHPADTIFSRLAMHAADMVWADSGVTLAGRRLPARKPRRIISFVMRRLMPLPGAASAPAPRFVSWARISPEKGMDRALQLIADLRKRGVDARFDVWGPDGGELTRLERLRLELGLGDSVRFRGPARHEDLPEIAAGHSFFLQLSRFEGMAMAAVEAMQLGLVPVVTPVGQMAEYVREGLTGIVVDPADIAGAADRLTRLLADPATFRSMREMVQERWRDAPLYADDVCSAAADLCGRRVEGP